VNQPARRHLSNQTQNRIQRVRWLFGDLRRLGVLTTESKLVAALERDDVSAAPDGWPSGHEGTAMVLAPDGERVVLTSVERAADARMRTTGGHVDPHHHTAARAERALRDLVRAAHALVDALQQVDGLQAELVGERPCDSCKRAGLEVEGERWGDVGRRLPEAHWLCAACYLFVQRVCEDMATPPRLPTVEELNQHATTGRWRVRKADR